MPPAPTLGYDRVARGSAASDQRVLAGPPAYHPKPLFRSHTPGLIKLSDSHLHNSLYIHILHALLGTTGKPQGKIRGARKASSLPRATSTLEHNAIRAVPFADIREDLRLIAGSPSLTPRDPFLKRGRANQPSCLGHFTLRIFQVTLEEAQGFADEMKLSGYFVPSTAARSKNVAMTPDFVGDASAMQQDAWLPVFVREYRVLSDLYEWLEGVFP
ncbi:hypothetical protein ALT_5435 [Aspergillus lentulus]|uniref:Uncharacterized protein n=1 Tax=Aspergillus lentulus TaxID=293939 RepID=A0AAN4PK05_ASPLE|nr:hypothetical protein ALT_5435 [Aspergillus lentulus]